MQGLLATTHHSLEQLDKQLATECTVVGLKPKTTACIDRRGRRDRLALTVHVPTTDGRELTLTRYTQPEPELKLLLDKLKLTLPAQLPPKISGLEEITAMGLLGYRAFRRSRTPADGSDHPVCA
jgi:hypothetical protein